LGKLEVQVLGYDGSADAWVVGSLILSTLLASALKIIIAVTKMAIVEKDCVCPVSLQPRTICFTEGNKSVRVAKEEGNNKTF
jgi:hypothetical protein